MIWDKVALVEPLVRERSYNYSLKTLNDGIRLELLDELVRVMKKINIYIWCNKNQLRQLIDYFTDLGCLMDLLTWHKTNPIPKTNNRYLPDTEYLLFFKEPGIPIYGSYETKRKWYVSTTNKGDKDLYFHPTIKPLNIIENLVINSSLEGDTVLDCFMGSGTTGVACRNLGRNFIGIEIDKKYFEIAKSRINNDYNGLEKIANLSNCEDTIYKEISLF